MEKLDKINRMLGSRNVSATGIKAESTHFIYIETQQVSFVLRIKLEFSLCDVSWGLEGNVKLH